MKELVRNRERAFEVQGGRCHYCRCSMWRGEGLIAFRERYALTQGQALQLRCTAEHVNARSDGGSDVASNIVAACWRCNSRRHRRKKPYQPNAFVAYVQRQVARRKWHDVDVRRHGLLGT